MLRILFVDDDPQSLNIGKYFLERQGRVSVDAVDSGRHALERLRQRSYDAVISDFDMPAMDGIALLKEIRAFYGDIPFILFSGQRSEEVVCAAVQNGADYYLLKSGNFEVQFAELAYYVIKSIERRQAAAVLNHINQRPAGAIRSPDRREQ